MAGKLPLGDFNDYTSAPGKAFYVAHALLFEAEKRPRPKRLRGLLWDDAYWHIEHASRAVMMHLSHSGFVDTTPLREALDSEDWSQARYYLNRLVDEYNASLQRGAVSHGGSAETEPAA